MIGSTGDRPAKIIAKGRRVPSAASFCSSYALARSQLRRDENRPKKELVEARRGKMDLVMLCRPQTYATASIIVETVRAPIS